MLDEDPSSLILEEIATTWPNVLLGHVRLLSCRRFMGPPFRGRDETLERMFLEDGVVLTRQVLLSIGLLAAVAVAGCTKTEVDPNKPKVYKVTGTITLKGKPVDGATVIFQLRDGSRSSVGATDSSGKYTLSTFASGDGAPAGQYQVTVTKYDTPPAPAAPAGQIPSGEIDPSKYDPNSVGNLGGLGKTSEKSVLGDRYASPQTSGLIATVGETGENKFDFDLK